MSAADIRLEPFQACAANCQNCTVRCRHMVSCRPRQQLCQLIIAVKVRRSMAMRFVHAINLHIVFDTEGPEWRQSNASVDQDGRSVDFVSSPGAARVCLKAQR